MVLKFSDQTTNQFDNVEKIEVIFKCTMLKKEVLCHVQKMDG